MNKQKKIHILIIVGIVMSYFCGMVFAEEDTATLSIMIGAVEFCASGTDPWQKAVEGMKLSAGDKIKTGIDGMLSILFTNGSAVTLKQNTEFEIRSLNITADKKDIDCKLQLTRGKLRAIIEGLSDNSSFEIRTPTAVAAVRGTIFYLNVREVTEDELPPDVKERLMTELFVEEGGVIYTNTLSGKYYAVSAGQTSDSYGDGGVTEPLDIPEDKQQEWLQGWEDILAAEPYQDPEGGADPDLGGAERGEGEDTGSGRQSDQLSRLLKQDESDIVWQEMCDRLLGLPEEPEKPEEDERIFLRNEIREILAANRERRVEGYIEKISDAQMGKVLTDVHGRRVRVEQYVLRPSPNVVEVLNVNLRDGGTGGDLTTMEWITEFNTSLDSLKTGQLKDLSWNSYLDTRCSEGLGDSYYLDGGYNGKGGPYIINPQPDSVYPESMSVKFSHNTDSFTESKKFHEPTSYEIGHVQYIYDQQLLVKDFNNDKPMDYQFDLRGGLQQGKYLIEAGKKDAIIGGTAHNPEGFRYRFAASETEEKSMIKAAFYVINNNGIRQDDYDSLKINSIWDALRVDMDGSDKLLGDNNLEMVFGSPVFAVPIDLIYIPFHDMTWLDHDPIPDYSPPEEP